MAVYFPTDTCELFLPGHHVHGIQWRQSQRARWRPVALLSRQGAVCRVRIEGVVETWRFHDEDAALVASWVDGATAQLSALGLLRLPDGGYLNPCREPEQWQDCRVQEPALANGLAEE